MSNTNGDQTALLLLIPVFFVLFGGGLFWAIISLMAFASGWRTLAKKFPAPLGFGEGKFYTGQSGRLSIFNYNSVLRIGVSAQGLYLACVVPFHFSHPPILIPWSQIKTLQQKKVLAWQVFVFKIGAPRITDITLYNVRIIESAGQWLSPNEHS